MAARLGSAPIVENVEIPCGTHRLSGFLCVPSTAQGVVVFSHGSGSGRHSPRNQFVARVLQESSLGTLLVDLLEEEEADDREKVFDISLLASRLQAAVDWLHGQPACRELPLGYFGASTGAAAALVAAAQQPSTVEAIVSRGGRPDLAADHLSAVKVPTLLIVGGQDDVVLQLNEQAAKQLHCHHELVVIPGATHLFPEPGALDKVARHTAQWFCRFLASRCGANS